MSDESERRVLPCRRALGRGRGAGRWELNPYRGCAHGCVYCEARATHAYLGMGTGRDFERRVLVRRGAPPLLLSEMRSRVGREDRIDIGTVTDPYQPAEAKERLTRRCLLAILEGRDVKVRVQTKSSLALRDLDLLERLEAAGGVTVVVSASTLDEELAAALEPSAPPPRERLSLIRRLAGAGIPVGLSIAPVLPGISDRLDSLDALVKGASEAGAGWVRARPLTVPRSIRRILLRFLRRCRPGLIPRYLAHYGHTDAPPEAYARRVRGIVEELRIQAGLAAGPADEIVSAGQLSLPFERSTPESRYAVGSSEAVAPCVAG